MHGKKEKETGKIKLISELYEDEKKGKEEILETCISDSAWIKDRRQQLEKSNAFFFLRK